MATKSTHHGPNNRQSPRILLVVMSQSPFNQSIWTGIAKGFKTLGCTVEIVDAQQLCKPEDLSSPIDILFCVHGANISDDLIHAYRENNIKTAVYLLDEPYEVDRTIEWAKHYEWIFSVDRATVSLHNKGAKATQLSAGYNQNLFNTKVTGIPSRLLMLGSPFSARMPYLEAIRENWAKEVTWVGPGWQTFSPAGEHYTHYVNPPDCARFYRGADIVINIHRDSYWSHFGELNSQRIEATHLNPRFWEASACGALVLSSYRSDIDEYAPESPTFNTVEEMVMKIDYFLRNTATRKQIATRVMKKMKHHSYTARCEQILETLNVSFAKKQ